MFIITSTQLNLFAISAAITAERMHPVPYIFLVSILIAKRFIVGYSGKINHRNILKVPISIKKHLFNSNFAGLLKKT
ncbi:hypothetical protein C5469_03000 [Photorhabdus cinerea]|uniref:Uncharacterized protein n=1 Tax=Photorhabdus cinerea TaxID=471575 RepID=A0A7X5TG88_9GAMM|nr:hypothetical protein [Photorhabdus cinerea]